MLDLYALLEGKFRVLELLVIVITLFFFFIFHVGSLLEYEAVYTLHIYIWVGSLLEFEAVYTSYIYIYMAG
jgi:hypothetical protein